MKMIAEHLWNDAEMGKPKYFEKNLSQCSYFLHKSHMEWHVIEPGPLFPVKMT